MRILTRYLSGIIVLHYGLLTIIAVTIASLIQILENRDGLLDLPQATMADMAGFSVLGAPGIFSLLAGFIALASVLLAAMALLRHAELKAVLAAGPSYGQLLRMLAPAAIIVAGIHFCVENVALPRAATSLKHWNMGMSHDRPGETDAIWIRQDRTILAVGALRDRDRSLVDVDMFVLDGSGRLVKELSAPVARYSDDALVFPRAILTLPGAPRPVVERDLRIAAPADFRTLTAVALPPRQSSVWDIAHVLDQTGAASHPRHVYVFWLHKRLAAPTLTALAVLLLAPFLQVLHRMSGARLLLLGLGTGFLYFVADSILAGLGEAGALAPAFAAWIFPWALVVAVAWPMFDTSSAGRRIRR